MNEYKHTYTHPTPFKLITSRDLESKWQEKRSEQGMGGRGTEQVRSMQMWPGEMPQSRRMGQKAVNIGRDGDI